MITGNAICEFGTGDILITEICHTDLSKGAICLQNKGTGIVGEEISTENFEITQEDTLLIFTKTESIDVLIRRLESLKSMMLGEKLGEYEVECDY